MAESDLGSSRESFEHEPSSQASSAGQIDHSLAWTIAFAPLIGTLAIFAFNPTDPALILAVSLGLNVALAYFDGRRLKAAGFAIDDSTAIRWVLLAIPVYLYKRAKLLGQSTTIVVVWCVCFLSALAAEEVAADVRGVPFDSASVERSISLGIREQSGLLMSVDCPSRVVAKAGTSFQCIASGSGLQVLVDVMVQNSDGEYIWFVR